MEGSYWRMESTATSRNCQRSKKGYLERTSRQEIPDGYALTEIPQSLEEISHCREQIWNGRDGSIVLHKPESRHVQTWQCCLRSTGIFTIQLAAVLLGSYFCRIKSKNGTRTLIAFTQSRSSAAEHEQVKLKRLIGGVSAPNFPYLLLCDTKMLFGHSIYFRLAVTVFASVWSIVLVGICIRWWSRKVS